ncbi:MAG: M48 family metallopeptidase [Methylococcaceae bacterium]|nr:M48 family metallopeptidase [Methylococcaceae bacterium]
MHNISITFKADFFDGKTSVAHVVEVSLDGDFLRVRGVQINQIIPTTQLAFSAAVGSAKAIIHLPNGAELQIADLASYDALAKHLKPTSLLHITRFLENHLGFAVLALFFSGAFIFAGLRYGLPALALSAANYLPVEMATKIGGESLQLMDKWLLLPSQLPMARRQVITKRLSDICHEQHCPAYRLYFRKSSSIGANAFALPAGDIVVTDDLVNIAKADDEVLSVLFHELGHVQHRHSLRLSIQSAGAAALLVGVTGDLSSVSDLAAGLPSLLMQSGYQRDMENEADAHALQMLNATCIDPQHFVAIMQRIGGADKPHNGVSNWLSSHPNTERRIQAFQASKPCIEITLKSPVNAHVK